jgi:sirohydrochlorin ferrochelatase
MRHLFGNTAAGVVGVLVTLLATVSPVEARSSNPEGLLVLAHGGGEAWNASVKAVVAAVNSQQPAEVAFGMASRPAIQAAIDALVARGVSSIVAVPLFVSSHSSVVRSTEFLLGLRAIAPADLATFARMSHDQPSAGAHAEGDHHAAAVVAQNMRPVVVAVPIRMTPALNRHPIVGEILASRARVLSTVPAHEAVILVAHGPSPDDDNALWLADMAALAALVQTSTAFRSVEFLTVRDDAEAKVRDAATAELRALVTRHTADGHRVLVVPLLMSFGGIERGIVKRLAGLSYVMASQGLMPDDRLVAWVRAMAAR